VKFLKKLPPRATLVLPLLWLLSGCAMYEHALHPHRLPTPKMSAVDKAKVRAAEKARHKGTTLKPAEVSTDKTDGAAGGEPGAPSGAGGGDEKKKTMSYSELPDGTKVTYDKEGLLRRSIFERKEAKRRRLHQYDTRPLTPREASRESRKLRKKGHTDKGKGKGKGSDARPEKVPLDPALDLGPDPGPPTATPTAPPDPTPAKSKSKGKKVVLPQPDPSQPEPEPAPKPAKTKKKAGKGKAPVPRPDPTQPLPDTGQ